MLLAIGRINNNLTLKMQNIDFAQETTAQLRANKNELKTNYSKQTNRNKLVFTHNVLETDETAKKGAK